MVLQQLKNAIFLSIIFCISVGDGRKSIKKDHDWDLLIFTQHWPVTVCLQYQESVTRFGHHSCILPPNKDTWTIHGVWPTKLHTEGPAFCNTSIKFDANVLDPIRNDLLEDWPNIEGGKGTSSLWRHEWLKHGTCAVVLDSLNSEIKYFQKGLELFSTFNVTYILNSENINPDNKNEINIVDVYNAVVKHTGKNPHIQCIREKHTNKAYLFEVRICFDKNFEVADCDGIKKIKRHSNNYSTSSIFTNCPLDETVAYPSQVPDVPTPGCKGPTPDQSWWNRVQYYKFLLNSLQAIQFLQWLTL